MADTKDKIRKGCFGCGFVGLVTFGIVFIVYPYIARVRETHKLVGSCASHLKEIGEALSQYTQDYDGALPPAQGAKPELTWRSSLISYLAKDTSFECADRQSAGAKGPDGFSASYAANTSGQTTAGSAHRGPFAKSAKPTLLTSIAHPAQVIGLCEQQNSTDATLDIEDPGVSAGNRFFAGHDGKSNYLFLDGHVQGLAPLDTANFWYTDGSPVSAIGKSVLSSAK